MMTPASCLVHSPATRLARLAGTVAVAALLAACAAPGPGGLSINRSVQARAQDSRVDFVVLHYTATDNDTSLKVLSEQDVSSHYLITREPRPGVYLLVPEERRAWHAGVSEWKGRSHLNNTSIGIEIVNHGRQENDWQPYTDEQIDTLIILLRDIMTRHRIAPGNVVGHSDIAPQRKVDPGPLFPWKRLADEGLATWFDEPLAARYTEEYMLMGLPPVSTIQEMLRRAGYPTPATGELDKATRNVLSAFQMRYRPDLFDGNPDARTLGILKALQP